jgi:hypothetical protein
MTAPGQWSSDERTPVGDGTTVTKQPIGLNLGEHAAVTTQPAGSTGAMPDFFLVGAMKAGTTSLANLLDRHPDIYLPPIKEPNFFATDVNASTVLQRKNSFDAIRVEEVLDPNKPRRTQIAVIRDAGQYRALYAAGADHARRGDCSTAYLFSKEAAGAIAACCPKARILIMVRDPVSRAISEYRMRQAIGSARGSLDREIDEEMAAMGQNAAVQHGTHMYLRAGRYAEQIGRFQRLFPPDNIKILVFERFVRDQQGHLDAVCDFLGIARLPLETEERANTSHVPRNRLLGRLLFASGGFYLATRLGRYIPLGLKRRLVRFWFTEDSASYGNERRRLRALFADEIDRMEQLLGTPLPEWRTVDLLP